MPLATRPVHHRGPAAQHPSSQDPSNPYNFPASLLAAGKQPPLVTDDYVFFFGYEGSDPHVCFQQWFPCEFDAAPWSDASDDKDVHMSTTTAITTTTTTKRTTFSSTEQYMMHAKALLFSDSHTATQILEATHPSTAKLLGRQVSNFDQQRWNGNCDRIVEQANYAKFRDPRNQDLKEVLLGTGRRTIVETSPDDRIWGIGFDTASAARRLRDGLGEDGWGRNGLGRALMRVRERLMRQKDQEEEEEEEEEANS